MTRQMFNQSISTRKCFNVAQPKMAIEHKIREKFPQKLEIQAQHLLLEQKISDKKLIVSSRDNVLINFQG